MRPLWHPAPRDRGSLFPETSGLYQAQVHRNSFGGTFVTGLSKDIFLQKKPVESTSWSINLRSDTVTLPTEEMRTAMMEAEYVHMFALFETIWWVCTVFLRCRLGDEQSGTDPVKNIHPSTKNE